METVDPALEGVVCNLARLRCGWAKLQLDWMEVYHRCAKLQVGIFESGAIWL